MLKDLLSDNTKGKDRLQMGFKKFLFVSSIWEMLKRSISNVLTSKCSVIIEYII